jgi:hypothetical protein
MSGLRERVLGASEGTRAGLVATAAMSAAMVAAQRAGYMGRMPPREITEAALDAVGADDLPEAEVEAASVATHFGFGASMGALLGFVRPRPRRPVAEGIAFGTLVWLASYAGWVPALGILPPPTRDRPGRPTSMVLAHWIYGAVLGAARKERNMTRSSSLPSMLTGLAAGAALAFFLDPQTGARRRAEVRQQAIHLGKKTARAANAIARDVAHRSRGVAARLGALGTESDADDRVIADRVRARLGRVSSHPRAIEVVASDGCVELRGPILAREVDAVVRAAARVRGVRDVVNALDAHESPEGIAALQGGRPRPGPMPDLLQEHWAPATRTLVGVAGVSLLGCAAARRTALSVPLALAGLGMVVRSVGNRPLRPRVRTPPSETAVDAAARPAP